MNQNSEAATVEHDLLGPVTDPGQGKALSYRQATFLEYFTAILTDMVVLGLFDEYWEKVEISSFTIILAASVILQLLLKLTVALEHRVAAFWNARSGTFSRFMRFFTAWLILFLSKFVILWALDVALGEDVLFHGALHGVVSFIVVVVVMVLAENLLLRLFRALA